MRPAVAEKEQEQQSVASKPAPATAKKEPEAAPAIATKKAGDPKASPPADKQGGGFFDFLKSDPNIPVRQTSRLKRPSQSRRPL